MSGFVYLWFDRKHKRFYVGSHWGDPNDRYICSSGWMKKAYKRRPADFKRRIISRVATTRRDLLMEELRWLRMIKPSEVKWRYYNLATKIHDAYWWADEANRLSVGQKISKALKGRKNGPRAENVVAKIAAGRNAAIAKRRAETGSAFSYKPGSLEKLRNRSWSGHSAAHREHMSTVMKARRAANPQWGKGRVATLSQRQHISVVMKKLRAANPQWGQGKSV